MFDWPKEGWFTVAGLACMGYGLWEVYQPAAFIVIGAVLIIFAITSAILAHVQRPRQ